MRRGAHRRNAEADEAFHRRIEEARGRHDLSEIIGRYTPLKKAGPRELVGLCVFHNERSPSLRVNDAKGTYHCFGCGRSGDAIRFLVEHAGLAFMDALRDLEGGTYPEVDPALRAQRAAEDEAEREAAIAEARRIWNKAVPASGTPAEVYCREARGIVMPLPPSIRFTETYAWLDKETGEFGPDLPALIGAVTKGEELVAIQRIFLRSGGRAKANMKKPKLSLGRVRGGALRLDGSVGFPTDPAELIITEGPEDGLSLAQELPGRRVWVALGTAMMPEIEFPAEIRSILIAGQNDDAGRVAVDKASVALVERGFAVRTMYPDPRYKDWNDQLRGIAR